MNKIQHWLGGAVGQFLAELVVDLIEKGDYEDAEKVERGLNKIQRRLGVAESNAAAQARENGGPSWTT